MKTKSIMIASIQLRKHIIKTYKTLLTKKKIIE